MNPRVGQWVFRVATTVAPSIVTMLLELQRQIDSGGDFDWRPLSSALVGAAIVAVLHVFRAGTERAESNAEVVTGTDQDADKRVETPE